MTGKGTEYTEKWPFRQADPDWGSEVMWNRDVVVGVLASAGHMSLKEAGEQLREFPGESPGNNIANEGCMLTSLAMVIKLLGGANGEECTPKELNKFAKEGLYWSECGVALVQTYADLVCDATDGEVQLCAVEQYPWPTSKVETTPSGCCWVQAYLAAPSEVRRDFALMLKIGTYDDSVASHYLLLDPNETELSNNPLVLDPVMPAGKSHPWRMADSFREIKGDRLIRAEIKADGAGPHTLRGVWVFGRWTDSNQSSLIGRLFATFPK